MKQRSCRGCGGRLYGPASLCGRCYAAEMKTRQPKPKRRRLRCDDGRNPEHLAWIRSLPCTVRGCSSGEGSEAAHVRINTRGGMGLKPPDRWTVPLCHGHHHEQHQIGHRAFDEKHAVDLRAVAAELATLSPFITD